MFHPGLMDSALQVIGGITNQAEGKRGQPLLPYAIEKMQCYRPLPSTAYVYVKNVGKSRYHLTITDKEGRPCIQMDDVALRALKDPLADFFYAPAWIPEKSKEPKNLLDEEGITFLLYPKEESGLEKALAAIHVKDTIVHIHLGSETKQISDNTWEVDSSASDAFEPTLDTIINKIGCVSEWKTTPSKVGGPSPFIFWVVSRKK